jgi:glucose-1-phosphate thymidylyltransferase
MSVIEFIGILPAAGLGSRLASLPSPKELVPVVFLADSATGALRPTVAAEYSLRAMHQAGVRRCLVVTSDRKPEIFRYLGSGSDLGLNIAYLNQSEPKGLAAAINMGFEWIRGAHVCLTLPDTVFSPFEGLSRVCDTLVQQSADVVLGVFPTSRPHQLGPVRVDRDGRVLEVLEKPQVTDLVNTWGIAAWGPRFTDLLHRESDRLAGLSIGHVFNLATKRGLNVRAVTFEEGSYSDLGTGESLAAMIFGPWNETDEQAKILVSHAGRGSVG